MNTFNIVYRFVPGEFSSNNNLRIIQDQKTSFIGGYYLSVKVPVDNHLRLYGRSSKVKLLYFAQFFKMDKIKITTKKAKILPLFFRIK
jgi:hypothetical protein